MDGGGSPGRHAVAEGKAVGVARETDMPYKFFRVPTRGCDESEHDLNAQLASQQRLQTTVPATLSDRDCSWVPPSTPNLTVSQASQSPSRLKSIQAFSTAVRVGNG